jgi:hypothetical protein
MGAVFRTAQGVFPDTQARQHAPLFTRAEDGMPLDVLEADLVGLGKMVWVAAHLNASMLND